jgi:hypothetical protein
MLPHPSAFFSWQYWDLNSGPTPEPQHQPFFVMGFFEIGTPEPFAQAGFELRSSSSLPSE